MRKEESKLSGFSPTRLEYFAGLALQGLITGRSEKDTRKVAARAVELATLLEQEIDS